MRGSGFLCELGLMTVMPHSFGILGMGSLGGQVGTPLCWSCCGVGRIRTLALNMT